MSQPEARRRAAWLGWALLLAGACGGGAPGVIHARLAYSEARGFRVLEVPPGPAARAGLSPEDRIVAIDGEPVRAMSYAEAVTRLRGPAGSEVTLTVVRGDTQRDITLERAPPRSRRGNAPQTR